MTEVSHADLDRLRQEVHSDIGDVSKNMRESFNRIHDKLDADSEKRARSTRWLVGIAVSIFTLLFGYVASVDSQVESHLQHAAKYTEKVDTQEAVIIKLLKKDDG